MGIFASGQVAATDTAIWTGSTAPSQRITLVLRNTSGSLTETMTVKLKAAGGTAREFPQAVLAPNESLVIAGLAMNAGDVLSASTTDATTVDYTITDGSSANFGIYTLDSSGSLKTVQSGVAGNQTISGDLTVQGRGLGSVETGVTAAGSTNADATILAAAKASHTVGGADDTKGVKIADTDDVAGNMIWIWNTVANKVLKVYGPVGASINGGTATTGAFSTVSGKSAVLHCDAPGTWKAGSLG